MRFLLSPWRYEKDAEPPLTNNAANTTVMIGLNVQCATPVSDYVTIETSIYMVSGVVISAIMTLY